jgi:hypothetical protein
MNYAVLQTSLDPPPLDALRQALSVVPGMVPYDADIIARDAYGILLRHQPLEAAAALQSALAANGVDTELVPEATLPQLPTTKFVKRLEITSAALMIFDPIGRKFPVEWAHLHIVAAGMVKVTRFRSEPHLVSERRIRPGVFGVRVEDEQRYQTVTREEQAPELLLELILSRGVARLSIEANEQSPLLFACLGERKTPDAGRNFALLVQDILQQAPHAAVNRGAHYLREHGDHIFYYPSKPAFFEENLWLLWQQVRPQTS